MTEREAMKQALEALEGLIYCIERDLEHGHEWAVVERELASEAITAIKEVLAQPEQKRPQNCGTGYCSCIECVMEPEQEPVAVTYQEVFEAMQALYNGNFKQQAIAVECGKLKLYITPPQREWVGLTKEEVEDIEVTWEATSEWSTFGHAVRYIETKLKEKNA